MVRQKIAEYAKLVAALLGAAVTSFAGQIPAEWAPWAVAASAFLTAVAVLLVPNAPTAAQRAQIEAEYEPKHAA
jgi:hypothetical protein